MAAINELYIRRYLKKKLKVAKKYADRHPDIVVCARCGMLFPKVDSAVKLERDDVVFFHKECINLWIEENGVNLRHVK